MKYPVLLVLSILISPIEAHAGKVTQPMPEIELGVKKLYDDFCGLNGNEKIKLSSKYALKSDTNDLGPKGSEVYVIHSLKSYKGRDYLNSIMIYNPKLDKYRTIYQAKTCKKIGN